MKKIILILILLLIILFLAFPIYKNKKHIVFLATDSEPTILGSNHWTIALDNKGNVYSWGKDLSNSNLAQGKNITIDQPTKIPKLKNIISISKSDNYALYLQSDGTVFASGDYHITKASTLPANNKNGLVVELEKIPNAIKVVAGKEASFVLTSDKKVYAWGSNGYGLLGKDLKKELHLKVNQINQFKNIDIVDLQSTDRVTAVLDSNGHIYVLGNNINDRFSLGTSPEEPGKYQYIKEQLAEPVKIKSLYNIKSFSLAASGHNILALNKSGDVFHIGLSFGDINSTKKVEKLELENIVSLANSGGAGIFLRANKHIYITGIVDNGITNNDEGGNIIIDPPETISYVGEQAKNVFINDTGFFILTKEGFVYSFGSNEYGKLGVKNEEILFEPTKIENLRLIN